MVIFQLFAEIRSSLTENPAFEAQQIIMSAAGMNNTEFAFRLKDEVSADICIAARKMAKRRIAGEPLQYIVGSAEFMGLTFRVNKNVLIPRADTETLVEEVLRLADGRKGDMLDIGTGSGCIGISAAHYNPGLNVTFLDISAEALKTAEENARINNVCGKFIKADILKETVADKFDIIVSNPPYIRPDVIETLQKEVKDYEPYGALCGGKDGLVFYRRIAETAPLMLKKDGILAFEIGYDQAEEVVRIMHDFCDVRIIKDLCGNDRVVTGKKAER